MNAYNIILFFLNFIGFFAMFFLGKKVFSFITRDYNLNYELVENDNPAVALGVTGYYIALVLVIGGSIVGPSNGIILDLINLCVYSILGIILINLSIFICDIFILYKFKVTDELIQDRNQGTGVVVFGSLLSSAIIIFASLSGEGGSILTACFFWGMGQIFLIIASFVYNLITPFNIHKEIQNDNAAAGICFSGVLISIGIILGFALEGEFISWQANISEFLFYALTGLIMLPIVRFFSDKILLPNVNLSDEIRGLKKDKTIESRGPNIGAAYIESFSYIAGAFIVYLCL
ncbi:MAG: hypothetical protein B6I26_07940 [Desulfobacteraceae bacterium 4572_130]|nr:MAG: hypothetical protein B6I26_07940 [Desulfobacteraceae bacterium 4572_130]